MTFFEARAASRSAKLHIRRSSWAADKWFMVWRGTWFVFSTGLLKPVRATDYTEADLRATDWTTVPPALAGCPITPTEPIGGATPTPGTIGEGYAGAPTYPPTRGGPAGGGPTTYPPLPLPDSGAGGGLSVEFSGITHDGDLPGAWKEISDSDLTGPFDLSKNGDDTWGKTFTKGYYTENGTTIDHTFKWTILVTNLGPINSPGDMRDYYNVNFSAQGDPVGTSSPGNAFSSVSPQPLDASIPADPSLVPPSQFFYGGHAVVSMGG